MDWIITLLNLWKLLEILGVAKIMWLQPAFWRGHLAWCWFHLLWLCSYNFVARIVVWRIVQCLFNNARLTNYGSCGNLCDCLTFDELSCRMILSSFDEIQFRWCQQCQCIANCTALVVVVLLNTHKRDKVWWTQDCDSGCLWSYTNNTFRTFINVQYFTMIDSGLAFPRSAYS